MLYFNRIIHLDSHEGLLNIFLSSNLGSPNDTKSFPNINKQFFPKNLENVF